MDKGEPFDNGKGDTYDPKSELFTLTFDGEMGPLLLAAVEGYDSSEPLFKKFVERIRTLVEEPDRCRWFHEHIEEVMGED